MACAVCQSISPVSLRRKNVVESALFKVTKQRALSKHRAPGVTNLIDISSLITNHLEFSIKGLDKYFPSISLEEYEWIRNPFLESLNVDFSLTEEEELAGISNDRTLRMKHIELDLDSFWILTTKEYPSI